MTSDTETARELRTAATRAFFAPRAEGWEQRFPDDTESLRRAIAELDPRVGGAVLDAGCGSGRALPLLRAAVGPTGRVIGVDITVEMLRAAAGLDRRSFASLVLADAAQLPLATGSLDAVFAAGLVSHLSDPARGLAELARVCRAGGRLALFHPIGRTALARRHGRDPGADDIRAEDRIRPVLHAAGWQCDSVDDADERYLALATRVRSSTTRRVHPVGDRCIVCQDAYMDDLVFVGEGRARAAEFEAPSFVGISDQTAGAKALSMKLLVLPAGASTPPHRHVGYESGVYLVAGDVEVRWGRGSRR